ncbi:hypothetical protein BS78_04G094600 [Paspalum vaginatum]|uniref:Auxin-responsive protein n=1 Tax=Paspalum vaginatum TaxID=158149 RepID=A0A9W7X9J2_9POAL|nr:hypothetical protein BS78_K050000 [Paspalum vaginatum]KAJ1254491.1 hypothetical protein BS78_K050000 [Paspalum vaginatum]KAJ1278643.1 hypothetical protein BS78_04G094600 [Paspalum vaginatum]KAJ1278644.1 hypothetical protein BS78_04G094600 [Paspalum vaginatum]
MGDAAADREGSKAALRNWMGEPRRSSGGQDQDDEEKALQLSLGLPGGGGGGGGGAAAGWRAPARDKDKHAAVDTSMLSLGYSAAAFSPCSSSPGQAKGSPAAAAENALASTNNASQTRSPNTPVIGWPPVRTFRRNLATSSKVSLEHQNGKKAAKSEETTQRAPFVKINMDGIPIGRKIDLNALDSYDKLSLTVDRLFRGLLAAQQEPIVSGTKECRQEEVEISGLLDGTGEYTLVYEDYEGDRVLVGDVPWGMFVSSVKRLRVLKTSDLSSSLTASGRKRTVAEC